MKYDYAGVGPHVREDVQKSGGYEVRTDYTHTLYVCIHIYIHTKSMDLSATKWRIYQLHGGGSVSYLVEGVGLLAGY